MTPPLDPRSVGHTPGPWKARDYRSDGKAGNAQTGSIWIDCDAWSKSGKTAKGGTLAEVYARGTGSADPAVQEANARLIAAAPDLLAACSDWIAWLEPDAPWREDAADHEARMLDAMRAAIAKATGAA